MKFAVVCCFLCAALSAASAQNPAASPRPAQGRSISGVVLNSVTGEPVRDADVSIADTIDRGVRVDTRSDADGRFVFAHLPTAKYELSASRRGYIASSFDEHEGGFSTAIATGDGLVSTDLKFLLPPQATISGAVTDEAGDPVEQAQVTLFRVDGRTGKHRTVRASNTNTDDMGEYEFARVAPGTYFICVQARPWYAQSLQSPSLSPATRTNLDVAFAATYYAGVPDANAATPVGVKAGDRVALNVTMHAVPAVHISIAVPRPGLNQIAMPQLRGRIFGEPDMAQASVNYVERNGVTMAELGGIAPGQYELELQRGGTGRSRFMDVDASGGSVSVDKSNLSALTEVQGKVSMQTGATLPAQMRVALILDDTAQAVNAEVVNGSFHFQNVYPGSYRLVAGSQDAAIAVKHMAAAGATVTDDRVEIGSHTVMLAATVDAGIARVNGFAKRKDKPVTGAMMVLIPEDGSRESIRRDQTDSDGSFTMRSVIPGRYTLVAIDDGWPLEWARPEVMQPYLVHGVRVTVPEGVKELQLKGPVEVQPR